MFLLQRKTSLFLYMMDSGDLVENGLTVPTTLDSANKEVDFKVIETSVAAEDAKKDDGDFQGEICASVHDLNTNRSNHKTLRYFFVNHEQSQYYRQLLQQMHRNQILRGILSDSEAEELDIEDGETDNFGDDERDSLGQPSPRRVTSGSGASLNRDHSCGMLLYTEFRILAGIGVKY